MASKMLANIGWLGFGNAAVKPLWFVFITYFCIEKIGLAEYGLMTAALALTGIAVGVSNAGTSQYTVREVARKGSIASVMVSNILPARIALSVVAVGLCLLPSIVSAREELSVFAAAGGYAIALSALEYERTFYRAFEKLRDESISVVGEKILVVAGGVVGIFIEPSAAGVLTGMFFGALVVNCLNMAWVGKTYARFDFRQFDFEIIKSTFVAAIPLGLAGIFVLLYFRIDSVMLKYLTNDVVTGQYGLAYRILEALILLPGVVVAALLPRLSAHYGSSEFNKFGSVVRRSARYAVLIATGLAVIVFYFAPAIIHALTNDLQPDATAALRILVWAFPFATAGYIASTTLISMDDQKVLAVFLGLSAIINIGLNFFLIPRFSLLGASAATVATEVIVSVLMLLRYATLQNRLVRS